MVNPAPVEHICLLIDGTRIYAILNDAQDIAKVAYTTLFDHLTFMHELLFLEMGIPFLSAVTSTRINHFLRPDHEINEFSTNLLRYTQESAQFFHEHQVKFKFIGDLTLFCSRCKDPSYARELLQKTEKETQSYSAFNLFLMAAYDERHECINYLTGAQPKDVDQLVKAYYGCHVPEVDVTIRFGRPRLSFCLPLLVGGYSDIFLYPIPFQYCTREDITSMLDDYAARPVSKGGGFAYNAEDIASIRAKKDNLKFIKPQVMGTQIGRVWFPFKKPEKNEYSSHASKS